MNCYKIFSDKGQGTFSTRLSELEPVIEEYLGREAEEGRTYVVYVKIFLSDICNQQPLLLENRVLGTLVRKIPSTIVGQPPLDGSKIAVLLCTSTEKPDFLFHSLRLTDAEAEGLDSYQQTVLLFHRYIETLNSQLSTLNSQLTLAHHCQRTWIYVDEIDRNYAGVVRARNDVFAGQGLTADTHFIASTGIGGQTAARKASVAIDFITFPSIQQSQVRYLNALDHLNKTHEYGVAFERATLLQFTDRKLCFISGTASIDRCGQILFPGDVEKQCARLLENISALLADGSMTLENVRYFIVYLRDVSDYAVISAYMSRHFPHIPYVITEAKVCRPGWLVEMECVAEASF